MNLSRHLKSFFSSLTFLFCFISSAILAQDKTISGPTGSGQFGKTVTVLPNGNYVVTDPLFDNALTDIGAVYLYNGATHALISVLTGSTTNDQIGNFGITVLSNGNYVVRSLNWDNGSVVDAGAVTWCNGTTGVAGAISATNSLLGSTAFDQIGGSGITALKNGNYIVRSTTWDNGAISNAGAVTWCDGTTGRVGVVSSSNSMVGSTTNDQAGNNGITQLSNGNYVVRTTTWDNGAVSNVGAVTWCDGATGRIGAISQSNSLVGSSANDQIGAFGITTLNNGHYTVVSVLWDNGLIVDAGAVTWCDGSTGRVGIVSSSNSLVGSTTNDQIGNFGITLLSNGNYIVRSTVWDNGAISNAGAVTWCDGTAGRVGAISAANSLVGTTSNDQIGNFALTPLPNGNYIVNSAFWDNIANNNAGAVTWCNGSTGRVGAVSASNSLVGTTTNDQVGETEVTVLTNGHYVVRSPNWDNGLALDAGAVTWCDGSTGRVGAVSTSNSLVGSTSFDQIGNDGITPLNNGNYVVRSINWDNGVMTNVGAVTWCNGSTGRVGAVSASNSLVGSISNDNIGNLGISALTNGHYVVSSPNCENGAISDAGAVTWCDGSVGRSGAISATNSLVGSSTNDQVGVDGVTVLSNGNYVAVSSQWDNGAINKAGAVTWCDGSTGRVGTISSSNSLIGSSTFDGVGSGGITTLNNGNYIVRSNFWDNGSATDAGAITWCNGSTGRVGAVSASNSLVGSSTNDLIGSSVITDLTNGNYLIRSNNWDNGTIVNGGAITVASVVSEITGTINKCNSVLGNANNPNPTIFGVFDSAFNYIIVAKPAENKIVIRSFSLGSSFNQTICANQSFLWNGIARNTSGAFKDTFPSFNGCDSVVTLNLTVTPLPNKLTNTTGNTITAAQAGATYQWVDCATNAAISGAIAQSFTPSFNGSFKVVVTQTNCSDTSACVPINTVGLNQNNLSPQVSIYPNPAREEITINISSLAVNAQIALYSLDGKEIYSRKILSNSSPLNISHLAPGIYQAKVTNDDKIEIRKICIEK